MVNRKFIIIGEPDIPSITLARLMESTKDVDLIAFGKIGNHNLEVEREIATLERAGIKNAREAVHQAMQVFSHQDLRDTLSDMAIAANNMKVSFNELNSIHAEFKANQPIEETKSRYINKPRYNFKRR